MKQSLKMVIILSTLAALLEGICQIIGTFYTSQLIDIPTLKIVIVLGATWGSISIATSIHRYVLQIYFPKSETEYKANLLRLVFKFPHLLLESKEFSDDLTKVNSNIEFEQKLVESATNITSAIVSLIGLFVFLYSSVSLTLLLILLVFLLLVIIAAVIINGKLSVLMYDYWATYIKNTRKYNYVSNVLTDKDYVEERKIYSYLPFFNKLFIKEFDMAADKNRELGKKRIRLEIINNLIFLVFVLFVFVLLLNGYMCNNITLGVFISVTSYALIVFDNICIGISFIGYIQQYRRHIEDVENFSKRTCLPDSDEDITYNEKANDIAISINNLYFSYPNSNKLVLNNISLDFYAGKKYAIVGANGSGKTTLAKIMCGLYSPSNGKRLNSEGVAILFQDFNKYPATIKENITLTTNSTSSDDLEATSEKAGLKKLIRNLSNAQDTELTTIKVGGIDLSGGEWQRIGLARILWQNKEVYILDEPTANLDPIEEVKIFRTYNEALHDKTVIYITHRLGFVKEVDEILVIDNGFIVERGAHTDLLKKRNGIYNHMFEEQKSWYEK